MGQSLEKGLAFLALTTMKQKSTFETVTMTLTEWLIVVNCSVKVIVTVSKVDFWFVVVKAGKGVLDALKSF